MILEHLLHLRENALIILNIFINWSSWEILMRIWRHRQEELWIKCLTHNLQPFLEVRSDWNQNFSGASVYKDLYNDQIFSLSGVEVLKSCKMWYFMSNSSLWPWSCLMSKSKQVIHLELLDQFWMSISINGCHIRSRLTKFYVIPPPFLPCKLDVLYNTPLLGGLIN